SSSPGKTSSSSLLTSATSAQWSTLVSQRCTAPQLRSASRRLSTSCPQSLSATATGSGPPPAGRGAGRQGPPEPHQRRTAPRFLAGRLRPKFLPKQTRPDATMSKYPPHITSPPAKGSFPAGLLLLAGVGGLLPGGVLEDDLAPGDLGDL